MTYLVILEQVGTVATYRSIDDAEALAREIGGYVARRAG